MAEGRKRRLCACSQLAGREEGRTQLFCCFSTALPQIAGYPGSGSCKGDWEETCLLPSAWGNLAATAVGVFCRWTVCRAVLASPSLEAVLCTDFSWESLRNEAGSWGKVGYGSDVRYQGDPHQAARPRQCPAQHGSIFCLCVRGDFADTFDSLNTAFFVHNNK